MKRFLLVQHHFFPLDSRGFRHLTRYANYLKDHGWEPVVLTKSRVAPDDLDRRWGLTDEGELASTETRAIEVRSAPEVPYDSIPSRAHRELARLAKSAEPAFLRPVIRIGKKPLSMFSPFFGDYPDEFRNWVEPAVAEGTRIIETQQIDAIISHCPIESNHLVASRLAARFKKPWFAFFGDLYGYYLDPSGPGGPRAEWMKWIGLRLRRQWLKPATRAFAVSPAMARYIEEHYGVPAEVFVVGYDETAFPPFTPPPRSGTLRIAHTGSIYPEDQPIGLFLDGVALFLKSQPAARVEIRFVGSKCDEVLRREAATRGLTAVCRFESKVPTAEAIQLQRTSDVLLAFNLVPRRPEGTLSYPSKIFEYLASGRRVLVVPSDLDWVDKLLAKTRAGKSASTAEEIAEFLAEAAREPGSNTLSEEVREFSSQRQAARVAGIINRAF